MYQYRHILVRMRLGESDRQINAAGLMGRRPAANPGAPSSRFPFFHAAVPKAHTDPEPSAHPLLATKPRKLRPSPAASCSPLSLNPRSSP